MNHRTPGLGIPGAYRASWARAPSLRTRPRTRRTTVSLDTRDTRHAPLADRLARKVLRIEGADPQALMSLKGSLVLSAIRCVIMYAVLPAAAPLVGWSSAVAAPIGIAISLAAVVLSLHSLRRVWLADWTYRWSYTAFIALVLGFLAWFIVLDVRTLTG